MSYEPLFNLPSGTDDIESVFKTSRGSTYAHHNDTTSTRNRSGANHTDKSTGIQQRSGKTIYMDPKAVNSVAGLYQNTEMATKFVPVMENGKPTGEVALQLTEDYGPKKAGTTLIEAPYTTKPKVGMNPVEIYGSESPIGSSGRNIHFGNEITEVHPKPARLNTGTKLGVLGVGAGLLSAVGSANAGEYKKAREEVGETATGLLPPPLQALLYAKGAGEGEQELLESKRRAEESKWGNEIRKAKGGSIKMPDEYSRGSWKLI